MAIDQLWPWRGSVVALVVALVWAFGLRRAGPGALASAAAAVALAAGWIMTLDLVTASPRQLAERLPVLALGLAVFALLLAGLERAPRLAAAVAWLGIPAVAWWMAGAPQHAPSLAAAAPVLAGVALLGAALLARMEGAGAAALASLGLLAGFWVVGGSGPQALLAGVLAMAALGTALGGAGAGMAARAALAPALAALAALPVIARGQPADWAVAAVPLLGVWLGPMLARRLPWQLGPLGWLVAMAAGVALAWMLARSGR